MWCHDKRKPVKTVRWEIHHRSFESRKIRELLCIVLIIRYCVATVPILYLCHTVCAKKRNFAILAILWDTFMNETQPTESIIVMIERRIDFNSESNKS